jgi:glucokinase
MNTQDELVLGIDIGGSHITVGFVDLNNRRVIKQSYFRAFINSWGSAEEILESWSVVIKKAFSTVDVSDKRIGIAMPGPFDYEAGISYIQGNKKYDALYGLNIKQLLAEKLNIPAENILMVNDATCFLKGEVFGGEAINHRKVIALTLGTGLGTAICDSDIAEDAALWDSPLFDGIAEDYISTRWFLKYYFEQTNINIMDVKALNELCGTSAAARATFRKFAYNLSVFLQRFIEKENPEMVVIGGNITKASPRFMSHLITCLSKEGIHVPIKVTKLGELAPILGAASYWANRQHFLEHQY